MKILTFNIRCDYGQDGNNNFEFRKPLIKEKLSKEKPDVICFQEVLPHVAAWLKETLTDYYVVGVGRTETYEGEQMTIAYRKDILNLMEFKTFWLSPTPHIPGSRYEIQSDCPRTCAVATFQSNSNKIFRVYNTHLDHISSSARMLGLNQLRNYICSENDKVKLPCILLGDFNAEPDSPEITEFNKTAGMVDLTTSIPVTFHDFGKEDNFEKIDYIYISNDIQANSILAWSDCINGVYLSDHYPICVDITIK
ncbi:endonuclease/exonuclease/phosphatase family protein [Clostridium oryzae]|uniref:Endonuclease/exonuclease/phosphatase family protein n=1 Tax=Clostridium oryzae TaxID=1450648 RepID=A0A1V4IN62_9CLOT|nr:endonuclease/exonuclease/phosphatase family protein [Clostridium oryzae]OPJ61323.1 endonuclease/exonuclease/phosphatase family protein [Clostridium oryzae]